MLAPVEARSAGISAVFRHPDRRAANPRRASHCHADAVFHFALAQIMQMALPMTELLEVFSHVPGDENVTGVAAIHYALHDIDSGAGNVGATTYVHHAA